MDQTRSHLEKGDGRSQEVQESRGWEEGEGLGHTGSHQQDKAKLDLKENNEHEQQGNSYVQHGKLGKMQELKTDLKQHLAAALAQRVLWRSW